MAVFHTRPGSDPGKIVLRASRPKGEGQMTVIEPELAIDFELAFYEHDKITGKATRAIKFIDTSKLSPGNLRVAQEFWPTAKSPQSELGKWLRERMGLLNLAEGYPKAKVTVEIDEDQLEEFLKGKNPADIPGLRITPQAFASRSGQSRHGNITVGGQSTQQLPPRLETQLNPVPETSSEGEGK